MLEPQFIQHPVQAIMSRTGSFPLHIAYNLLKTYGAKNCIVLDPFCGKGTALLAAQMLGFSAYGLDIAPEAVICSSAKLTGIKIQGLRKYIEALRLEKIAIRGVPSSVRVFFHPSTLSQILSIRKSLLSNLNCESEQIQAHANFSLACLLGILHGHASYSLSLPCAHAYSMAPGYVAKYAIKHGLKAPERDVKDCLIKKATRCLRVDLPKPIKHEVKVGSALHCTKIYPGLVGKVDIIITSPPYLNAQTYAKDNWLRLWLLGHDYKTLQPNYIETGSVQLYKKYMTGVFGELFRMLKPYGKLICIAGDVRSRNGNSDGIFKTGIFLDQLCRGRQIGFRVEKREKHKVLSKLRYFHALNGTNGHTKHDLVEREFVALKPEVHL